MAELDIAQALPTVLGAVGGGGGVVWLARTLLLRTLRQYDRKHAEHEARLREYEKSLGATADKLEDALGKLKDRMSDSVGELRTKVAVVESMMGDARALRSDVQASVQSVQQGLAKVGATVTATVGRALAEVDDLRADIFVAHRRIELLAAGDTDIGQVKKTSRKG